MKELAHEFILSSEDKVKLEILKDMYLLKVELKLNSAESVAEQRGLLIGIDILDEVLDAIEAAEANRMNNY